MCAGCERARNREQRCDERPFHQAAAVINIEAKDRLHPAAPHHSCDERAGTRGCKERLGDEREPSRVHWFFSARSTCPVEQIPRHVAITILPCECFGRECGGRSTAIVPTCTSAILLRTGSVVNGCPSQPQAIELPTHSLQRVQDRERADELKQSRTITSNEAVALNGFSNGSPIQNANEFAVPIKSVQYHLVAAAKATCPNA
jgi:hypothetical protein